MFPIKAGLQKSLLEQYLSISKLPKLNTVIRRKRILMRTLQFFNQ